MPSEGGLYEKPNDTCAKMCRMYVGSLSKDVLWKNPLKSYRKKFTGGCNNLPPWLYRRVNHEPCKQCQLTVPVQNADCASLRCQCKVQTVLAHGASVRCKPCYSSRCQCKRCKRCQFTCQCKVQIGPAHSVSARCKPCQFKVQTVQTPCAIYARSRYVR